ncbi:MAG: N-6 DNA methylase [Bacteroidaceae bacterium]|nr:N-6 DNA methylase [Bacteroidaceae bacterium]
MNRSDIIQVIGRDYLVHNIENDEFRYPKAFKERNILFSPIQIKGPDNRTYENLDIRFVDDERQVAVLVETKSNFDNDKNAEFQLSAYMIYEHELTGYATIGILANTEDDRIRVWRDKVCDDNRLSEHYKIKSFKEYANLLKPITSNNKEKVTKSTYELNEKLQTYGINAGLRSQFVGTCLLALRNGLKYKGLTTSQIISGIKDILTSKLDKDLNKALKLGVLAQKVLESQDVRYLPSNDFESILNDISVKILPYINDETSLGQDLLNLFFTTFNKYVGKGNKNQAFTPDHIVHFMCKVVGINRNSRVLDPCCGSGAFLVRAMTEAIRDCQTEEERNIVYKEHIYGIEYDEMAFGLSTTNMLIHNDGNTNIKQGSCFEQDKWIEDAQIDRVLMNPPYNADKKTSKKEYAQTWKKDKNGKERKEDPSKGFHFVYHIANVVKKGKLAVLLPMQCAIGTDKEVQKYKEMMLQEHHLNAVFSLPSDIFHPGASANACCMVFDLGIRHKDVKEGTFFGYYKDDGFRKKKNLGRVEKIDPETGDGVWAKIEELWLDTYKKRIAVTGLSAIHKVTYKDEWLCEAYMKTDYSTLTPEEFEKSVRNFAAYCISSRSENYDEEE